VRDGTEGPLYLECLFPFVIVEQKFGWSGLPARLPTHLRIKEVGKRAIEFLAKLDAYENQIRRQTLHEEVERIRGQWEVVVGLSPALSQDTPPWKGPLR
jgi:hypothetical protein